MRTNIVYYVTSTVSSALPGENDSSRMRRGQVQNFHTRLVKLTGKVTLDTLHQITQKNIHILRKVHKPQSFSIFQNLSFNKKKSYYENTFSEVLFHTDVYLLAFPIYLAAW